MPGSKKCPACAEDVKVEALICKHCGHEFRTRAGYALGKFTKIVLGVVGGILVLWVLGFFQVMSAFFGH